MYLRVFIAVGLLGTLNYLAGADILRRIPAADTHFFMAWGLIALFFLLQLAGPFGERLVFHKWTSRKAVALLSGASYMAFGILSCVCLYILVIDMITLGWILITQPADPALFDQNAMLIMFAFTALMTVIGFWQARLGPVVTTVEIPLKNLPRAFDGFRIVQITDLHAGPTIGRAYVENVVRLAKEQKPDLAVLTGDFADGHVATLGPVLEPLAQLTPAYFITGNHEYYWDARTWLAYFKNMGVSILHNEHRVIERGGAQIVLGGVPDPTSGDTDPGCAFLGAPAGPRILLMHQPSGYRAAEKAGADLTICGHTHGGQYFPFTLFIALFQKFYKGLNRYKNMWVYVSRGAGYWGPPLRTFNRAEINLLVLRPAA